MNWLPQPPISTRGSTLHQTCTVELAATARLVLREEQLLGRTAKPPGHLTTRLTVRPAGSSSTSIPRTAVPLCWDITAPADNSSSYAQT